MFCNLEVFNITCHVSFSDYLSLEDLWDIHVMEEFLKIKPT